MSLIKSNNQSSPFIKTHPSPFIKTHQWLVEHLNDENLRIVDASWFLPAQNRQAKQDYLTAHIPGAIFFDLDEIVNKTTSLPHALPDPQSFANAVGLSGISNQHHIIIYDALGMFTAPRVWWMFKTMGAHSVFLLDGGFDNWKSAGLPITNQASEHKACRFTPGFNKNAVATIEDVIAALDDDNILLLDARSAGRFTGEEEEPRDGMRSGHMPGAINIPVFSLSDNGNLKSVSALQQLFAEKSVDLDKKLITTCGSGITAAVINLALHSIGKTDVVLYDGSWSEWGARTDSQIETG